jgi:hypothetical protein
MASEKKELREVLKSAIKTLILQEVRVLQLEQAHTPSFVINEMTRSIQEAKKQVIALLRLMPHRERNALIKRVIRQSVNEEIDRAIETRKNRCLRCIHVRYFDEAGSAHENLPFGIVRARMIGCEVTPLSTKIQCLQFIESPMAILAEEYLSQMSFLYELKEMFDQFERIWEDYLLNK